MGDNTCNRSKLRFGKRARMRMLAILLALAMVFADASIVSAAEATQLETAAETTEVETTEVVADEESTEAEVTPTEAEAESAENTEVGDANEADAPSDSGELFDTESASNNETITEETEATQETTEPETATEGNAEAEEMPTEVTEEFDFEAWYNDLMNRVGEDGLVDPVLEEGRRELVAKYGEEMANEIMSFFEDGVATFAATMPRFETPDRCPTDEEVYQKLMSFKNVDDYREGTRWTNHTPYGTEGPIAPDYIFQGGYQGFRRGVGCAGWAFLMSDANFGWMPGRLVLIAANPQLYDGSGLTLDMLYDMIRPGDILRLENGSHFVIVAAKGDGGVIVTEANFNKSVHYGRAISRAEVLRSEFFYTRHAKSCVPMSPEDAGKTKEIDGAKLEGKVGTLDWRITNASELIITGSGAIADYNGLAQGTEEEGENRYRFEYDKDGSGNFIAPPWYAWRENIETITIGEGVTKIGKNAFFDCKRLLRANLPQTLEVISEGGFRETTLMSITIPGNVKTIGKDAFRKCLTLTSVTLSEGVETLEDGAFRACTALRAIVFPASIKKIGAAALFDCHELKSASFKESANTIEFGWDVFRRCWNMETIDLPKNMTAITPGMFTTCMSLDRIFIPKSITEIGKPYGDKDAVGAQFPFTDAGFIRKEGMIYFGGTKDRWDEMVTNTNSPEMKQAMKDARIQFGVDYKNPYGDGDNSKDLIDDTKLHEHAWSKTAWESDANGHWRPCENNGCDVTVNDQKGSYVKHEFPTDWTVDKPADIGVIGSQHRDCRICKYREIGTIAAKRLTPIDVPVDVTINTNAGTTTATLDKTKVTTALDAKKGSANDTKTLDVRVDATGKSEKTCRVTIPTDTIAAVNSVNDGTYSPITNSYINAKPVSYVVQSDAGTVKIAHQDIYYASRLGYDGDKDVRIDIAKQTATDVPKAEDAAGSAVNVEGATVVKIEILKNGTTPYTENKSERPFEISVPAPTGTANGDYATVYYVNPSEKNVLTKVVDHVKVENGKVDFSVNHFTQFVIVSDANAPKEDVPEGEHKHDWSPFWNTTATHHWHNCAAAGCEVTDVAAKDGYGAHEAGAWKTTRPATTAEKGLKEQQCSKCGYVMATEEIPMLTEAKPDPEPEKPVDPVDPKPTDPVDPKPTDPVEPVKPDPEKPTEPVKPDPTPTPGPEKPVEPTPGPTEPEKPVDPKPIEPTEPAKPEPEKPSEPGTIPSEPSKPGMNEPEKPGVTNPTVPTSPTTPANPGQSGTGNAPEKPGATAPEKPVTGTEPSKPAISKAEATKQMKTALTKQLEEKLKTQVETQLDNQLAVQLKTQLAKELKKYAGKDLTAKQKANLEKKLMKRLKVALRAKLRAKLGKQLKAQLAKELSATLKSQYGTPIGKSFATEFDKQFKAKYAKLFGKSFKQYDKKFAAEFTEQFKSQYEKVVTKK